MTAEVVTVCLAVVCITLLCWTGWLVEALDKRDTRLKDLDSVNEWLTGKLRDREAEIDRLNKENKSFRYSGIIVETPEELR
jgi:hypothetical protein